VISHELHLWSQAHRGIESTEFLELVPGLSSDGHSAERLFESAGPLRAVRVLHFGIKARELLIHVNKWGVVSFARGQSILLKISSPSDRVAEGFVSRWTIRLQEIDMDSREKRLLGELTGDESASRCWRV
jgi:hypothetical protein